MRRVPVPLGDRSYEIVVGRDLLVRLDDVLDLPPAPRRTAIVTQEPIARHHLDPVRSCLTRAGYEVAVLEVPDGEQAKDLDVLADLYRGAAELALHRDDLVVALGGGVVGDLAGFLAATWNRGISVVQIPTTLLAQVDAAIGGKTGVNLPQGKNLVGAFHQPVGVVADVDSLATLPDRIFVEGLAEVVKYGLIRDPEILTLLEEPGDLGLRGDPERLTEIVARSAHVKAAVVAADEREAGVRAHLNLGHTYGHVIETLSGYGGVLHGEAVAMGIRVALELGVGLGLTDPAVKARVLSLFEVLGLPSHPPVLGREEAWTVMERDKKVTAAGVRFVVVEGMATPTVVTPDRAVVEAAIAAAEG